MRKALAWERLLATAIFAGIFLLSPSQVKERTLGFHENHQLLVPFLTSAPTLDGKI